ncbi:MAG: AAA family ATPase, partial [Candidatus Pacebacteria bacterium]|nr:AAA family ATPase [Candidatus Paceibacterota bacterium]
GRTFHSFFGLGILEGGIAKTIAKASSSSKVQSRISESTEIVIDEISMISPQAFEAAEAIARKIKGNTTPFGGMRLILVGDFHQLPPVNPFDTTQPWLFDSDAWASLEIETISLGQIMRTSDIEFMTVLGKVRNGLCDASVAAFLNCRKIELPEDFSGTVLFPRKDEVESYNTKKLNRLSGTLQKFETKITTDIKKPSELEKLLKLSPLPKVLSIKEGALVMIRKNDEGGDFANGSLGTVDGISADSISINLLNGKRISLQKEEFQILDADGKVTATIVNFPLTLGWACTIHKAQGTSIERLYVSLGGLWESGQAYVALSRATNPDQLFIGNWTPSSIRADSEVVAYYSK